MRYKLGAAAFARVIEIERTVLEWLMALIQSEDSGVTALFSMYACMDTVDWFNLPYHLRLTGKPFDFGIDYSVEVYYYVIFMFVTIASDSLFIAATRWLLRKSSKLSSGTRILGLMLGNVLLAVLLVILPITLAWGFGWVREIVRSGRIVEAATDYVGFSNSHQSFLASLGASNVLDGLVASTFFILLFILLLHRLMWPSVHRPIYTLANRGVVRRRKLFLLLGVVLVGLGGMPTSALSLIEKLLSA